MFPLSIILCSIYIYIYILYIYIYIIYIYIYIYTLYIYITLYNVARSISDDIKKQIQLNNLLKAKEIHSLNITERSKIPQWKISHHIETKQSTCSAH